MSNPPRRDTNGSNSKDPDVPEQLVLPGMPARRAPGRKAPARSGKKKRATPAVGAAGITPAEHLPVARVSIDVAPLHLDRPFDYLVPEPMSADAQPGTRVKVRFGAQDVDGFILERIEESSHKGRLSPIRRLVSPEVVLSPPVTRLARAVADYYGGTLSDVLRLAIPPRHARVEAGRAQTSPAGAPAATTATSGASSSKSTPTEDGRLERDTGGPDPVEQGALGWDPVEQEPVRQEPVEQHRIAGSAWTAYNGGEAFLRRMQAGFAPRAVWTALPGDWGGAAPGGASGDPRNRIASPRVEGAGDESFEPSASRAEGSKEDERSQGSKGSKGATSSGGTERAAARTAEKFTRLAGGGWEEAIVEAILAASAAGLGSLVVLPDLRDVDRLTLALEATGLAPYGTRGGEFARLLSDDGAAQRYRSFLAVLRGDVRIAIGTRAAAFAPVRDLSLVVCWEDAEATHQEPRAPYPHVRDVLALRSELEDCAFLVGSVVRSAQAQALLESGWAREISASRPDIRARTPRVRVLDSTELASEGAAAAARIPTPAWRMLRDALGRGPVLIQVPRRGYIPVIACQNCREAARCQNCHGPLGLALAGSEPQCTWCGQLAADWRCSECGGSRVRSVRVGSERTAEELGRAFPGVSIKVSGAGSAGGVLDHVTATPAIIVSTPGAEPIASGGYSAALLLDAGVTSAGVGLDSGHHALHRWISAASLVRSNALKGVIALVGDTSPALTNALVSWDPVGYTVRDLTERTDLGLPPAVRVGAITGDWAGVTAILDHLILRDGWQVLGPIQVHADDDASQGNLTGQHTDMPSRAIVTAPRREGRALAVALRSAAATRSLKREGSEGRIELDPEELL